MRASTLSVFGGALALRVAVSAATFIAMAALTLMIVAPVSATAQVIPQKRVPDSLPSVLSGRSIHSTAPKVLLPNAVAAQEPQQRYVSQPARADEVVLLANSSRGCSGASVVCYDYRSGRAIVPVTRLMMPDLPGLTRESVTLKRDKVAFNYSF